MGPYLTTPKKEKETENGEGTKVLFNQLQKFLGEIRCLRYARLEKHNGGFSHRCNRT